MSKLEKRREALKSVDMDELLAIVERYALWRTINRHLEMSLAQLKQAVQHWRVAVKTAKTGADKKEYLALLVLTYKLIRHKYGITHF